MHEVRALTQLVASTPLKEEQVFTAMSNKTFLLLGGYGYTGACLVPLLLQETNIRIRVAGRNLEKAKAAAKHWNRLFPGDRVEAVRADAADPESLRQACSGIHFVLVASCTARFARNIAVAALESGADYLDVMFPQSKLPLLRSLADRMTEEGRCFITEAGFHPGLAAALVHYANQHFLLRR